jgi:hypothetical protein
LILTSDGKLFKMDPTKKFKVMLMVPMSDLTHMTISPDGGNQVPALFCTSILIGRSISQIPIRPKTFWINVHPRILGKCSPKTT